MSNRGAPRHPVRFPTSTRNPRHGAPPISDMGRHMDIMGIRRPPHLTINPPSCTTTAISNQSVTCASTLTTPTTASTTLTDIGDLAKAKPDFRKLGSIRVVNPSDPEVSNAQKGCCSVTPLNAGGSQEVSQNSVFHVAPNHEHPARGVMVVPCQENPSLKAVSFQNPSPAGTNKCNSIMDLLEKLKELTGDAASVKRVQIILDLTDGDQLYIDGSMT